MLVFPGVNVFGESEASVIYRIIVVGRICIRVVCGGGVRGECCIRVGCGSYSGVVVI